MSIEDDKTPIWFLDIDGVINAVTRATPEGFSAGYASPAPDDHKYKIQWNPEVVKRIQEMHDSGLVNVMWLTTWGSGANGALRELVGLCELEVAGEPPSYASGGYNYYQANPRGWWKLGVVQRFYAENPKRKYVWTDDDLALEPEARAFIEGKNIFAIAPNEARSLSLRDLELIEAFLSGKSAPKYRHNERDAFY